MNLIHRVFIGFRASNIDRGFVGFRASNIDRDFVGFRASTQPTYLKFIINFYR